MQLLISHSWKDKSISTRINETLIKDGHNVWMDIQQLIPGDNIQEEIDKIILKCDALVLVWSKNAATSDGVEEELLSATRCNKRIIPLQCDETPINKIYLKDRLGIQFEDYETGILLLQRALIMLTTTDEYKEAPWFKEAFGNVSDLGGYINYINTFRLKGDNNNDGFKDEWLTRIEELKKKNEYINEQIMPATRKKMQEMQDIMQKLESGNLPANELQQYRQWCIDNQSLQPALVKKMQEFIENDINRLSKGGKPSSSLDFEAVQKSIIRLENEIAQKKDSTYQNLFSQIKKFGGLFLGDKVIDTIVSGYLKYITNSPKLLQELLNEAKISEYIAVKEALVKIAGYLDNQDHGLAMRKNNLDGYFDAAYIIINTIELLIEADLVAKNSFSIDFVSVNIINKYVSFILNNHTKSTLDGHLQDMRKMIGLKKHEINWGQVASLLISASLISSGIPYFSSVNNSTADSSGNDEHGTVQGESRFVEDRVAALGAKYGINLNY